MFAARTDNNFVRVAIVVKIDSQKPVACRNSFICFYMGLNIYLFSMVDICILAHQFRVFSCHRTFTTRQLQFRFSVKRLIN